MLRRRKLIRLRNHNYSKPGRYFVTICTYHRYPWFGEIRSGIMGLSMIGCMAYQYWMDISGHFNGVTLDTFVIMPDHMHGIVVINNSFGDWVGSCHGMTLPNRFARPVSGSLGMIINHYKSAVTRWAHANGHPDFQWQPRYYDRIIRTARELYYVRKYIRDNPKNFIH